jgi:hypothetical protein
MKLLIIAAALVVIAKIKYVVLAVSWAVIILCMWVLWVKRFSKNERLHKLVERWFKRLAKLVRTESGREESK